MSVKENTNVSFKIKVQKFGAFLSAMVMPNIGAFVAWGIITAFFIPTGWIPNEELGELVGPTLTYLLPILIAYTGGYNVYERRGGVIGTVATMGVIIGADVTMLIGAMMMGPASAWILKKFDKLLEGKVRPGLEMLVDNFSLGIIAAILMIFGYFGIEPVISFILEILTNGVNWVVDNGLTPLASIFVAPGQVLFLNNAINHGIMVPLGTQQVAEFGKSILFFVEANNGPLTGVLLAYCVFGKGIAKKTAPTATIIALFGGIGEVYFPYILMKPKLILGTILGSMTSLTIFQIFGGGAVAAPSPGSIFAFLMVSPKDSILVNALGFFTGMAVSFLVAGFLLKRDKSDDDGAFVAESLTTAADKVIDTDSQSSTRAGMYANIKNIYICCDAGMGSSAMGANILKSKVQKARLEIEVGNRSISNIPDDADMIITLDGLLERAKNSVKNPDDIIFIGITNFLENAEYDKIIEKLK